jgi:SagB-type dehydrogenase family enzyme
MKIPSMIPLPALLFLVGLAVLALQSFAFSLPAADTKGEMTLTQALARRRSCRNFTDKALTEAQLAQLCWAGQGITEPKRGFRTAPSAGATFPLELYVATANGLYNYDPARHELTEHRKGDLREQIKAAAFGQSCFDAPAIFLIAADISRTAKKYGQRSARYVFMEGGHAAQNILLQATALGLAGVPVGACDDEAMAKALQLPQPQYAFYYLPIGHPAE